MTQRTNPRVHFIAIGIARCQAGRRGGKPVAWATTDEEKATCVACKKLIADDIREAEKVTRG